MMDPVIRMRLGECAWEDGLWLLEARNLERETGFEPATSTLARSHSTTELLPLGSIDYKQAITSRQRRARCGAASLKFGPEHRRSKKPESPRVRGCRSTCGPARPAREKL